MQPPFSSINDPIAINAFSSADDLRRALEQWRVGIQDCVDRAQSLITGIRQKVEALKALFAKAEAFKNWVSRVWHSSALELAKSQPHWIAQGSGFITFESASPLRRPDFRHPDLPSRFSSPEASLHRAA